MVSLQQVTFLLPNLSRSQSSMCYLSIRAECFRQQCRCLKWMQVLFADTASISVRRSLSIFTSLRFQMFEVALNLSLAFYSSDLTCTSSFANLVSTFFSLSTNNRCLAAKLKITSDVGVTKWLITELSTSDLISLGNKYCNLFSQASKLLIYCLLIAPAAQMGVKQ